MGVKVKKRPDGWYIEINNKKLINNKRGRFEKKVGANRADAYEVKRQLERQIAAGLPLFDQAPKAEIPTLAEYYRSFRTGAYFKGGLRERTQDIYNATFKNFILPVFGHVKLDAITREAVKLFVGSLIDRTFKRKTKVNGVKVVVEKRMSRPSIRIALSCFSSVINHAVDDEWIHSNPVRRLTKFYREAPVVHSEIQPLTATEVPIFLEAVAKHSPEHFQIFLCALHTGMRAGEIVALKWTDVDWNGRFIVVRHSTSNGATGKTKTGKIRKIDLSNALFSELQLLHEKRKQECWKRRKGFPEWVFINSVGGQLDLHNLRNRVFYRTLRLAGLRRIRFHDLRHTFATLLIMQGESLAYVRDQLGHASISMTVNTYTHWIPGSNRAAMDKLPAIDRVSGGNVLQLKKGRRS